MVKKSIVAIALLGMLASVTFAADPFPGSPSGQIKIDGDWPKEVTVVYNPVEICRIPIKIKIGMFIEIENCSQKQIVMEQVTCPSGQSFPCYKGCVTIKVRANFEAQLSLKLYKIGDIIRSGDNWKAYFTNGGPQATTWIVSGDGNWNTVDICVEAWDCNIYYGAPGSTTQVGEVAVLAIPTAVPTCP